VERCECVAAVETAEEVEEELVDEEIEEHDDSAMPSSSSNSSERLAEMSQLSALLEDVEIEEVAEQLPRHSADADSGGKPQPNTKPYIHRRYYL